MKTTVIINGKEEEREVDYIQKSNDPLEQNLIVPVLYEGEVMTWALGRKGIQAVIFKKHD